MLIGNSRWHWAAPAGPPLFAAGPVEPLPRLRCWHTDPPVAAAGTEFRELLAWSAVGPLPPWADLPAERRLGLGQVPLQGMPSWLGIDRALSGWAAWRHQQVQGGGAVLVADAGTALSLTWVDSSSTFRGGRLQAGVGLQLRAMAEATALLPLLALRVREPAPEPWPKQTSEAMRSGCLLGVAAAIAAAWRDLAPTEPTGLWLTGGDGPLLEPLLVAKGIRLSLEPDLCLQGLAALSSEPGR